MVVNIMDKIIKEIESMFEEHLIPMERQQLKWGCSVLKEEIEVNSLIEQRFYLIKSIIHYQGNRAVLEEINRQIKVIDNRLAILNSK